MDSARVIVPPLLTAYAIFVVIVVRAWDGPKGRSVRIPTRRDLVGTMVGGYLVFLAIVAVFHVGLAGQHGALKSAALGGGFLLLASTAVYLAGLWTMARISRMRSRREGDRANEGDGLGSGV
jgi:protein-S-isoprenylcysteine O-methyltransferase Ste14